MAIKSHYDTDGALQLDQERTNDATTTTTTFRPVKYPRVLRIDPEIRPPEVPIEDLDDEYYIVATESGDDLLGYLRALADLDRGVGWITHLVVVPRHRRNQVWLHPVGTGKTLGRPKWSPSSSGRGRDSQPPRDQVPRAVWIRHGRV